MVITAPDIQHSQLASTTQQIKLIKPSAFIQSPP